ncbi:MAG: hypothetical protein AB8B61_01255 [Cyclobacteriaceae bacterium]
MSKTMTLDVLSSIKGAEASKDIDKLFANIKNASVSNGAEGVDFLASGVTIDSLRADVVNESTEVEKALIKENFPKEKNGYLVVAKVID